MSDLLRYTTPTPIADSVWGGEILHEEWNVVDQWWTETPIRRHYRDITRLGRRRVEMREIFGQEWTTWQEVKA